ncbi:hypothetical protein [Streptomyces sp. NPDC001435]|uniref:hypothetical protein n=1 Tax=Streptomyces sp. NPDC001435 TaxID=3364576 RepID=UPI0036CB1FE5
MSLGRLGQCLQEEPVRQVGAEHIDRLADPPVPRQQPRQLGERQTLPGLGLCPHQLDCLLHTSPVLKDAGGHRDGAPPTVGRQ